MEWSIHNQGEIMKKLIYWEVVMALVTLGVFSGCIYFGGMKPDIAAAAAAAATAATAATFAFAVIAVIAATAAAAAAAATATAATAAAFAAAAAAAAAIAVAAVIAVVVAVSHVDATNYSHKYHWVLGSLLVEGAVIYTGIFFGSRLIG